MSARKPEFFQMSHPLYEVVTGEGLMRPCFKARTGNLFLSLFCSISPVHVLHSTVFMFICFDFLSFFNFQEACTPVEVLR